MRTGDLIDGRYQLEDVRGGGAGGMVWTAFDRKLKRTVALKRPHAMVSEADRIQFCREAETAAQVQHPNAISIFDTVEADGCWLVMEYLPAESLDRVLAERGPRPPEWVTTVGAQIAAALAALHQRKIVHRDVKPGNVLVTEDGVAKLTDFGISVWREVTWTHEGDFRGTPAYAAPEVASGHPADEASDVFSLGATLFTALEGVPPFGAGEPGEVLERARRGEVGSSARAGPLAPLLEEMLAAQPLRRPTADQVRQRLEDVTGAGRIGLPPAGVVRPRWWRRRHVQVLAVLVLASTISAATLVPTLWKTEPAADLVGDEHTVAPCALVDPEALSAHFGVPAQLHSALGNFNRCDVILGPPGADAASAIDIEVQLLRLKRHPVVGELYEDEGPPGDGECAQQVPVDERFGIQVAAKGTQPQDQLCVTAKVAADQVRGVLDRGPIPRRDKPLETGSLAHVDACALLDRTALAVYPAIDATAGARGFGGWRCRWYSTADQVSVLLRYDQHSSTSAVEGESIPFPGHEAHIDAGREACTVHVVHRPADRPAGPTIELMMLTVEGPRPDTQYCPRAIGLAEAAASRLPR
ncbi:protein kinase domain-containing protein [Amycolatopsis lurida]